MHTCTAFNTFICHTSDHFYSIHINLYTFLQLIPHQSAASKKKQNKIKGLGGFTQTYKFITFV